MCGVHKYMHKRYTHVRILYVHTYVRIFTYVLYTYVFLAQYECCLYFPLQESADFTSHCLVGSQCHPSNHKVHIRMHIPTVN